MIDPNFHQLRIFYTVAKAGSFSRASEELFISQPAVSIQVKALETTFGEPLIERSSRGLRLTEAGAAVFDHAQRIFNISDSMVEAVEDIKGLRGGRLTIVSSTTPGDYLLPELIGRFKELYPMVNVELHITNTPGILRRLLQHEIDLGFVGDPVEHEDLEVAPFRRDEIVVFAQPDHPYVLADAVQASDLRNAAFIMREPGSATRKWAEESLRSHGIEVEVAMELGGNEAVKRAVAAGLGLGMLSRYALDAELASGSLAIANVPDLERERWLYLARHRQAHLTRAQQAFMGLALEGAPA